MESLHYRDKQLPKYLAADLRENDPTHSCSRYLGFSKSKVGCHYRKQPAEDYATEVEQVGKFKALWHLEGDSVTIRFFRNGSRAKIVV